MKRVIHENTQADAPQLVCMDGSISPFFYTKRFDLQSFCDTLTTGARDLVQPVYLVVDNTLDFQTTNAKSLFPNGIPRNVFLIFTPSFAKLHQLGLDMVTGGMINLHCHPDDQQHADCLMARFESNLDSEHSRQGSYELKAIIDTFYRHNVSETMSQYTRYMIEKRQRNITALVEGVARILGSPTDHGVLTLTDPLTGSHVIKVLDQKEPDAVHEVEIQFHYDPTSRMLAYLKILEAPGGRYIASNIFEEIKRRVFEHAASQGIHIADGTSWGFTLTRMDSYMHTLRIAVGLEHQRTSSRLGSIFGTVLKEFLWYPNDFIAGTSVVPHQEIEQTGKLSFG